MEKLKGNVRVKDKIGLDAIVGPCGVGFEVNLFFKNLNPNNPNSNFPEYSVSSIPLLTITYSSGSKSENEDYLITSNVRFGGFFDDKSVKPTGKVRLKPNENSEYLRYLCHVEPDQWRRMREIAQNDGLLELKLLVSISLMDKKSTFQSEIILLALGIPMHISKVNLEQFINVWTKARDSIRDLPNSLPEKVLLDMLEASKCIDIEVSKAAVVMTRRALQNALLLKGVDKTLSLYKQIDMLKDMGIISSDVSSLAHGVRYLGNFGAHPDEDLLNEISFEDAKLSYHIVMKMLKQLFPI
jgi:hypothetical protein